MFGNSIPIYGAVGVLQRFNLLGTGKAWTCYTSGTRITNSIGRDLGSSPNTWFCVWHTNQLQDALHSTSRIHASNSRHQPFASVSSTAWPRPPPLPHPSPPPEECTFCGWVFWKAFLEMEPQATQQPEPKGVRLDSAPFDPFEGAREGDDGESRWPNELEAGLGASLKRWDVEIRRHNHTHTPNELRWVVLFEKLLGWLFVSSRYPHTHMHTPFCWQGSRWTSRACSSGTWFRGEEQGPVAFTRSAALLHSDWMEGIPSLLRISLHTCHFHHCQNHGRQEAGNKRSCDKQSFGHLVGQH